MSFDPGGGAVEEGCFPTDHQGIVLQLIPILEQELGVQVEEEQVEYGANFQASEEI